MSWTDEEIDKLAQESAANSSVEYKPEYWTEFEALLPAKGKKDFLWFFTAFLFLGVLSTSFIFKGVSVENETQLSEIQNEENRSESFDQNNVENIETFSKSYEIELEEDQKESNEQLDNTSQFQNKGSKSSIKENKGSNRTTDSKSRVGNTKNNHGMVGSSFDDAHEESASLAISQNSDFANRPQMNTFDEIKDLPLRPLHASELNPSIEQFQMDYPRSSKTPAQAAMYVNGFGGISQSLITPSNSISSSFGLGFGVQIQKGRFTITSGINGVWSNHKDLILSRSAKVYGFGSNEYNYQFNYKQIYSLEAELSAGYKMGRHLINLGVRPSYVIGTKVGVVESVNDEKTLDRNIYGYTDGINRFGLKPMIGYAFDITPSLKIGVNASVELMPRIKEGFLVGNSSRFPIDGQLYLRKSIRFKK